MGLHKTILSEEELADFLKWYERTDFTAETYTEYAREWLRIVRKEKKDAYRARTQEPGS